MLDKYLSACFGSDEVFRASKSIPPGSPFVPHLLRAVRESALLLAVIGQEWLTVADARGRRRLDDPEDLVRREIAVAFEHGITVVPVLMDADRLTDAVLPPDIAALVGCQDFRVHFRDSDESLRALAEKLEEMVPGLKRKVAPESMRGPSLQADSVGAIFNGNVDIAGGFTVNNSPTRGSGGGR